MYTLQEPASSPWAQSHFARAKMVRRNVLTPPTLPIFPFRDFFETKIFPQQRKVMGSLAQNSSGVHWCRRRVRFNEVAEKVPKVPEKVWEALAQSQVTFNRVPEKGRRSGLWCRARSGSTGFWRRFGAEPGEIQQGSKKGSCEGLGGFGAEPSQVQQGS